MSPLLKTLPLLLLLLTAGCSVEEEKTTADEAKKDHIMRSQIDTFKDAKEARALTDEATRKRAEEAEKLTY